MLKNLNGFHSIIELLTTKKKSIIFFHKIAFIFDKPEKKKPFKFNKINKHCISPKI